MYTLDELEEANDIAAKLLTRIIKQYHKNSCISCTLKPYNTTLYTCGVQNSEKLLLSTLNNTLPIPFFNFIHYFNYIVIERNTRSEFSEICTIITKHDLVEASLDYYKISCGGLYKNCLEVINNHYKDSILKNIIYDFAIAQGMGPIDQNVTTTKEEK